MRSGPGTCTRSTGRIGCSPSSVATVRAPSIALRSATAFPKGSRSSGPPATARSDKPHGARGRGLVDQIGAEILLRLICQPDPGLGPVEQRSLGAVVMGLVCYPQALDGVLTISVRMTHPASPLTSGRSAVRSEWFRKRTCDFGRWGGAR